jgi:tight adherence protein B
MKIALYALYVFTAFLALEGLARVTTSRADPARVRKRLHSLAQRVAQGEVSGASMLRKGRGLQLPTLHGLEKQLYRAGGSLTANRFMILSVVLAVVGFGAAFVFTADGFRSIPGLLLGLAPWFSVRRTASKRMKLFAQQLPDALELLTRCMRTGHALGAGFQMVGDEFPDPIGTEFGMVAEEIRLGLDIREALENMMRRVDNDDLPYFTTAVLIQRQTGGNLAELLDKLGSLLRERIQFTGRVHALTAQGRGAATFLACWLPFIIVVVWFVAPDYLEPLLVNDWGHMVLAAAFGIDALAYFMALRIADVQT